MKTYEGMDSLTSVYGLADKSILLNSWNSAYTTAPRMSKLATKVSGDTIRGSNSFIFASASLLFGDQHLKTSKFVSLREDYFFV